MNNTMKSLVSEFKKNNKGLAIGFIAGMGVSLSVAFGMSMAFSDDDTVTILEIKNPYDDTGSYNGKRTIEINTATCEFEGNIRRDTPVDNKTAIAKRLYQLTTAKTDEEMISIIKAENEFLVKAELMCQQKDGKPLISP